MLASRAILMILGHGAMITPSSRNAVDRHVVGLNATQAYDCNCGCCNKGCGGQHCSQPGALAACGDPGTRANISGQPCLW